VRGAQNGPNLRQLMRAASAQSTPLANRREVTAEIHFRFSMSMRTIGTHHPSTPGGRFQPNFLATT
jgi:hypothetical protein